MHKDAFKKIVNDAASTATVSDALFADIVYNACSQFGIEGHRFRNAFGLSDGSVDRWTQMKNLPHPSVRQSILLWIRDELG